MKTMLRRRFLMRVGPLICGFVAGAIVAVWALQQLLSQYDLASAQSQRLIDGVEGIDSALRFDPAQMSEASTRRVVDAVSDMEAAATAVGAPRVLARVRPLRAAAERLQAEVEAGADYTASRAEAQSLAHDLELDVRNQVFDSHQIITGRLRLLVLGLTISALLMVNIAVFVLLRTAQMVLKPVGALVEGSRELAAEHFQHRVTVERDDEFGELARAYNQLAEELERSEERKTEALRQLAVTLNHSLNNAMSIIELQLGILDREVGGNPVLKEHLHQIRASLLQMSKTVASLRRIRRVVLTDYSPGERMVDLEASVALELPEPAGLEGGRT